MDIQINPPNKELEEETFGDFSLAKLINRGKLFDFDQGDDLLKILAQKIDSKIFEVMLEFVC